MPNADARSAFDLAQKHSARLQVLHAEESALVDKLRGMAVPNAAVIESELKHIRKEWAAEFKAYNAAMKIYVAGVQRSRKQGD